MHLTQASAIARTTTTPTLPRTFRAAYLPETSTTGEVCLTLPGDSSCSDSELLVLALVKATDKGKDVSFDDIVIGDWTE